MKIKDIPKIERPIERLINKGEKYLSNEELLSIIIKCGTKDTSAKDIALQILKDTKDITNLKDITISRLKNIKGVGVTKAATIKSAIELGRRIYANNTYIDNICYTNSKAIYESVKDYLKDEKQEHFICLYFDNKQHILGKEDLYIGTVNKSIVHPREIFRYAYLYSASGIICIHNHPSGESKPSKEDISLTNSLVEIGKLNKIPILDHIIICNNNYYSFSDNGQIN